MWMTPAPPFTALVAASIWSGTGDVNTSPGQAASSMPLPTNPPCSGSCPEPPRDQGDLPLHRRVLPDQDLIRDVVPEDVRHGGGEPGKRLFDHLVRFVDDLPHAPGGCGHGSTLL